MFKLTRTAGLMVLILLPAKGIPLGLGEIELRSALNEPLDAEVSLLDVGKMSINDIVVNLASASEFERLGIDRPFFLTSLQMAVQKTAGGRAVIRLTSTAPVKEPFIDMLLSLSWPEGRMVREYTLLLDPPLLTEEKAAPVAAPAAAATTVASPLPQTGSRQASASRLRQAVLTSNADGLSYGPVKRNDTLWSVAETMRGDRSLTIPQVMLALVRENPEAFYRGNVNALKAGYVLRIKDPETMSAVTPAAAEAEVQRQYREWVQGKGGNGVTSQADVPAANARGTAASGGASSSQPRLQLVAPDESVEIGQAGGELARIGDLKTVEGLRQQLLATLEASDVAQQENQALRERLTLLEKQIADMQRLISLKGDALAAMQLAAANETVSGQDNPVEAGNEETTAELAAAAGTTALAVAGKAKTETVTPQPPAAPAPPEAGLLEKFMQPFWLAVSGGGLLLLLLLTKFMQRRRQAAEEAFGEFDEPPSVVNDPNVDAADGQVSVADAVTAESLLDSMQENEAATTVEDGAFGGDEEEIDTLSEADVYLAYCRYDKAEQLLQDALQGEPERRDLVLKLLETYALSDNKDAFVARAESLRDSLNDEEQRTLWPRVTELGKSLLGEDHALFSDLAASGDDGASAASDEASVAVEIDDGPASLDDDPVLDLDAFDDQAVSTSAETPESPAMATDPVATASDADETAVAETTAAASPADDGLDVPLEFALPETQEASVEEAASSADSGDDVAVALDDADALATIEMTTAEDTPAAAGTEESAEDVTAEAEAVVASREGVSEDDLSWLNDMVDGDLGELLADEGMLQGDPVDGAADEEESTEISGEDSIATQLDLARAFIDMGDVASAREILEKIEAVADKRQSEEVMLLLQRIA